VETEAIRRRVDLQISRIELVALARSYGLTNATRFINLLQVSGIATRICDREGCGNGIGPQVEFQIPIFDGGEVRVRQAGEAYMQTVNRLIKKAVDVRSQARETYLLYRARYDVANHYRSDVLPLRQIINEETMLRYNAMQLDVFPLLTEAQRRIAANIAAIEAQRDFWLANTDLDAAVIGGGVAGAESATPAAATSADSAAGG
jgi:outer membrane protein TolC